MAMLLLPTHVPVRVLRSTCARALAPKPLTPVTDVALALAELVALQATFTVAELEDDLRVACQAVERPLARELVSEGHQVIERFFVRLVRYLEKRLVDGSGAHTRCFEVFVPDVCVPHGRSFDGQEHREHVVPCAVLRGRCNELLHAGVPVSEIANWLRRYLVIVQISARERDRLDIEVGLKTKMPSGWNFESGCVFARLHEAEILFEPPTGYAVCRHGASADEVGRQSG